jgi:hypothetical protein
MTQQARVQIRVQLIAGAGWSASSIQNFEFGPDELLLGEGRSLLVVVEKKDEVAACRSVGQISQYR